MAMKKNKPKTELFVLSGARRKATVTARGGDICATPSSKTKICPSVRDTVAAGSVIIFFLISHCHFSFCGWHTL